MGGWKKEMLNGSVMARLPSSLPAKLLCVQQGWMVGGGMALVLHTVVKFCVACPFELYGLGGGGGDTVEGGGDGVGGGGVV